MDKIVDHLFVFRGQGETEDIPGNYSDFRAYEDSAAPEKEEKTDGNTAKNWKEKQVKQGLTFNEQKEFQKIERGIKDLEYTKKQIEQRFTEGSLAPEAIESKALELQKIIKSLEEKEGRWFELSAKMEG